MVSVNSVDGRIEKRERWMFDGRLCFLFCIFFEFCC